MTERRAILLDFGGTLDSEGKHWSTQFADSFAASGVRAPRSDLDAAFIAVDRAVSDHARAPTMSFADYVLEYTRRILTLVEPTARDRSERARASAAHFVHHAVGHLKRNGALLERYQNRFRFAVVSNFTANLPLIVEEVGLGKIFEEVCCSAIEGMRKPDPAIFQLVICRLGVAAERVAMIGDSLGNDIEPAKALGLTTIWLRSDKDYSGGDPSAADHVVTTLADALQALASAPTRAVT
jgi:HAD superfamily hydrolase (TIGR01549 family)